MSRPLRILTIGHSHVVGANRAMWRELAQDPQFDITVAAPRFFKGDLRPLAIDPELSGSPLKLVPLDSAWTGWIHGFHYDNAQLRKLMREGEFDIVHAWEEPYIYAGYQIARSLRDNPARFVFRTAQNLLKRYPPPFSYFEKQTLRRAQAWIAGGELVFETMLKRGYPQDRGQVLTLAVDLHMFRPLAAEERRSLLGELKIQPPVFGFVGRLSKDKGLGVLMQAMELLPASQPWHLLLLGSGAYKAKVESWAKARGWQDRIHIQLVRHEEAARYVGCMDLLLAPSQTTWHWREQFGRMIVEAFACGVPVVGSDSGEIPFVIGDSGRVVSEQDPAAWANAIQELLRDAETRQDLARRGRERAIQYSCSEVAARFREFYCRLAQQQVAFARGLSRTRNVATAHHEVTHGVGLAKERARVLAFDSKALAKNIRILGFATQGAGASDECRLRTLLEGCSAEFFPFDYSQKWASFFRLLRLIRDRQHDLFVMEGTGSAGGLALILGNLFCGVPYVVSSGDAVGPFLTARWPIFKPIFHLYEKALCKRASGFIGWTPYLVGRALTLGAPRAMTAAGWAPELKSTEYMSAARVQIREKYGIPNSAIVFGLVGSLVWSKRFGYCYGYELVHAIRGTCAEDIRVLIVGDGDGRAKLEKIAGDLLGHKVIFTGRVPRDQVIDYLSAMDVASLPQSVDGVGSFRYSTKLSEYLASRLPVVTNQIPAGYDLDVGGFWRLAGESPWDARYINDLMSLMDTIDHEAISQKKSMLPHKVLAFQREQQVARVTEFLNDIAARLDQGKSRYNNQPGAQETRTPDRLKISTVDQHASDGERL